MGTGGDMGDSRSDQPRAPDDPLRISVSALDPGAGGDGVATNDAGKGDNISIPSLSWYDSSTSGGGGRFIRSTPTVVSSSGGGKGGGVSGHSVGSLVDDADDDDAADNGGTSTVLADTPPIVDDVMTGDDDRDDDPDAVPLPLSLSLLLLTLRSDGGNSGPNPTNDRRTTLRSGRGGGTGPLLSRRSRVATSSVIESLDL